MGGLGLGGGVSGLDRVGVAGVGDQVRAGGEIPDGDEGGLAGTRVAALVRVTALVRAAAPAQHGQRARGAADQVERIVGRERGQVASELGQELLSLGGGAQRQVSPAAAAGGGREDAGGG